MDIGNDNSSQHAGTTQWCTQATLGGGACGWACGRRKGGRLQEAPPHPAGSGPVEPSALPRTSEKRAPAALRTIRLRLRRSRTKLLGERGAGRAPAPGRKRSWSWRRMTRSGPQAPQGGLPLSRGAAGRQAGSLRGQGGKAGLQPGRPPQEPAWALGEGRK